MLIHSVYFWLDRKLTPAQKKQFQSAVEKLRGIEVVEQIFVGPPGSTNRPAVDRTYDVGLAVVLKDLDAHQTYQDHSIHKNFLQNYSAFWTKVTVYDIQTS